MTLQVLAGTAMGLVVGLLVGMTTSPVVATVIGSLTSGMLLLLGFGVGSDKTGGMAPSETAAPRMVGFGFACSVALLCGLYLRTHDVMSPSSNEQVQALRKAGFTDDEAHAWVAYKDAGLKLRTNAASAVDGNKMNASAASVFFAQPGVDNCRLFDSAQYPSPEEQLIALRNAGGDYAKLAVHLTPMDEGARSLVLASYRGKVCP